jgi:hypothetical protein
MKKLVILTLILAAGLTAYPQSASRSKESKSSSSSVNKSSSSRAKSSAAKVSSSSNRSSATQSRSSASSKPKATQSKSTSSNRSQGVQSRSSSANKSQGVQSRSSSANRSQASQSRSSSADRVKATQSRSSSGSQSQASQARSAAERNNATRSKSVRSTEGISSSRTQSDVSSRSSSASRNASVDRSSANSSRSSVGTSASRSQSAISRGSNNDNVATRVKSSSGDSFDRSNRNGNKVYVRRDGNEFRHQNDEVFATRRYKVDYRNESDLRRSDEFRRVYRDYDRWYSNRYRRTHVVYHYHINPPIALEIRRVRYPYRQPVHIDLCWTPWLHNRFMYYYPTYNNWNHDYGHYIETVSSYDAMNYVGSVKRIYGKVEEVYYSEQDKTYTLYFGAAFPYHDFSVVVPRRVAKEFSWSPSWYFENEFVWAIGLIDLWEGKPEIVIHDEDQLRRY